MIPKDKMIKVTNRSNSVTGYRIPELNNLRRQFQHGESKMISFEELEKLSWMPGGVFLLKNCLVIDDPEVVTELLHGVEPEYYYDDFAVQQLLQYGTLDQLLDCLDFAPTGVIEMVKRWAVQLPCNDVLKREAILEKTGFDVTKNIEFLKDAEDAEPVRNTGRRAAPIVEAPVDVEEEPMPEPEPEKPVRRSAYTVTQK